LIEFTFTEHGKFSQNLKSELFVIQAAAFNSRGDKIATVDQRGSVYLFHISSNRYALVARSGVSGTAISFAPGPKNELLVAYADGTINVFSTGTSTSHLLFWVSA
jgi:Tol biopolymer transport system component